MTFHRWIAAFRPTNRPSTPRTRKPYCATERSGRQLTAPRSRIYATVLYAVVASAREQTFRPTLDAAEVLDSILGGAESVDPGDVVPN
ncbi:hypothetical protein [Nocardia sp. CA-119907]|uniref:hypothetical protein n=1 Tax=Nocardia sp. CA-119907 TaxID=3239973 RepID=UPI003D977558